MKIKFFIRTKLLLSYGVLLTPLLIIFSAIIYHLNSELLDNHNRYNKILLRFQAIEELKATLLEMQVNLVEFLNTPGSAQSVAYPAGRTKSRLLTKIADLKKWEQAYTFNTPAGFEASLEPKKLAKLEDEFIQTLINYTQLKERNLNNAEFLKNKKLIRTTQEQFIHYINTALSNELERLDHLKEDISEEIKQNLLLHLLIIIFLLVYSLLVGFFTSKIITKPIVQLRRFCEQVNIGDMSPVEIHSHDESEVLAQTLNEMIKKLVVGARTLGMAETATSVLHNVGNVLNNVNVSFQILDKGIMDFVKLCDVSKLYKLLQEHQHDIAHFINEDPKGKNLIPYLEKLSELVHKNSATIFSELETMKKSIQSIKEIITSQQSTALSVEIIEPVRLDKLIEEALLLSKNVFRATHIKFETHYEFLPPIKIDRVKILQILINLLKNAFDAVNETTQPEKMITIKLYQLDSSHLSIDVTDNGSGINAENINKLFSFGFTTKRKGHGFGLHASLLAAKEQGGSLSATSPGPGQGSTFTLTLPIRSPLKE